MGEPRSGAWPIPGQIRAIPNPQRTVIHAAVMIQSVRELEKRCLAIIG